MGNIRHKWMVLLVVLVTTFATAQEAVRQYDGFREQANEWASSRLLASLLNTSAPEEELVEAQTVAVSSSSCSAEERSDEPAPQPATQAASHQLETKTDALQHRDEAIHLAINETPVVMQHIELSEAGGDLLDSINEVSLLTDKNHAEMLETLGQPEGIEEPQSAPEEEDADADSSSQSKQQMRFINRVSTETSPRLSETDIDSIRTRAAFEAQVQARAARIVAIKVLEEKSGRPIRVELKLIKKADKPGGAGAAPLRVANIAPRMDAPEMPYVLPAPPALQPSAPLSPNSACAGE